MKIKPYESMEEMAEVVLDGEDYDQGKLEDIEKRGIKNSKAIGRLIDVLMEKVIPASVLTESDIKYILTGRNSQ